MHTEHKNKSPAPLSGKALRIDTSAMYTGAVGAGGLPRAELDGLAGELARVHELVTRRRQGGLDAEYASLNLHEELPKSLTAIEAEAARLRAFADVVVIGIGGSNLGAMAVLQALAHGDRKPDTPRLHFLDNIDPDFLHDLLARLDSARTAVVAISKSGGTVETAVQYLVLRDWLRRTRGPSARDHQWIVTDPQQGWLRALARDEGLAALPVPPRVGGRYSVLTAVGLLPLAAAGVDIRGLLEGAAASAARCDAPQAGTNPALEMAALYFLLHTRRNKRVSVLMPYIHSLRLFGDWYRQLWAESLGKRRADGTPAGTLPVPALGAVDQHSQLQMYLESPRDLMFAFIALDAWAHRIDVPLDDASRAAFPFLDGRALHDVLDAEFRATRQVITDYGHPNLTITLPQLDAHVLGQLIDLYQRATIYAGLLYGIDPLDQPAVESGKRLAIAHLRGEAKGP